MEAALWALARWADTYDYLAVDWKTLEGSDMGPPGYPANPYPAARTPAAAQQIAPQDAAATASHTISACVACIMQFPAEGALHEVAVERLLRRVVCQRGRACLLQQVRCFTSHGLLLFHRTLLCCTAPLLGGRGGRLYNAVGGVAENCLLPNIMTQ